MRTVGSLFKEARFKRKYSREKLGQITHIRPSFIAAIENGKWEDLPAFNITLGFVKTISHFLNVDEFQAMSFFRREYPASLKSSPGQVQNNIKRKFVWGPRITFGAFVLIIFLVVSGYLIFQYRKFNSPPTLILDIPKENQIVNSVNLRVSGKTDPDATVIVNNQFVVVNDDGSFSAEINVNSKTNGVLVIAKSRSGKESIVNRKILVKL